ncbi:MAG: MarR family EPS-associated transcriptional regulator, partial [Alphaproteobacteria bacterium]|nr:MarR family EPS-associated transcriptional regulator [Alphaproteobacteria bacterium]
MCSASTPAGGKTGNGGSVPARPRLTPRQKSRREDTDFRILKLVQEKPDLTQRELADALGLSLGAINYCLRALLDRGLIKVRNFSHSDRKLTYAYLLTPSGFSRKAELTARFLKRKMDEYEQLKAE